MSDSNFIRRTPDPLVASRFRGCLLGGAVGDALGAAIEFLAWPKVVAEFGAQGIRSYAQCYGGVGLITDDTQMTLFTAEGMLRAWVRSLFRGIGPVFTPVTCKAYLRWLWTQGEPLSALARENGWLIQQRQLFAQRAPGLTCLAALREKNSLDEVAVNDSKGCGAVMRVAPIGLFAASIRRWSDARIFDLGVENAALTHGHPSGQVPAGAMALMLALIAAGLPLREAVGRMLFTARTHVAHYETTSLIERACQYSDVPGSAPEVIPTIGQGWVAEEALAIGLYCALRALRLHPKDKPKAFDEGVISAVNHGGDSDSTGSIAGNLLGAELGVEAIGEHWLADLELRQVITEVADDLATVREWKVGEYESGAENEYYVERYPGG